MKTLCKHCGSPHDFLHDGDCPEAVHVDMRDDPATPEEDEAFAEFFAKQDHERLEALAIGVNLNPEHYKQGDIECIDAIRAALTPEEFRGYCKANVIKYVWRERHKQQDTALRKARDYLSQVLDGQWSEQ